MHTSQLYLLTSFFGQPTLQTGCTPAGAGAAGAGLAEEVPGGGQGDAVGDGNVRDEAAEPPVTKGENESF